MNTFSTRRRVGSADIHQLFMDTGVGRSAYSIMEQGKIDLILSSRPEDRRAIFEEAAGITKYKAQKKEALRKARIHGGEPAPRARYHQGGSPANRLLQRQAAKARRYQALMKDLRIFDTHLTHKTIESFQAISRECVANSAQGEEARTIHESEIVEQESELSRFRARMEDLDDQASRMRDNVQTLKSRVFSAENRIATSVERCQRSALIHRAASYGNCGGRRKDASATGSNRTDRPTSCADD